MRLLDFDELKMESVFFLKILLGARRRGGGGFVDYCLLTVNSK